MIICWFIFTLITINIVTILIKKKTKTIIFVYFQRSEQSLFNKSEIYKIYFNIYHLEKYFIILNK